MLMHKKLKELTDRCAELEAALIDERLKRMVIDVNCLCMCYSCSHAIKLDKPQQLVLNRKDVTYIVESSPWFCTLKGKQLCGNYTPKIKD